MRVKRKPVFDDSDSSMSNPQKKMPVYDNRLHFSNSTRKKAQELNKRIHHPTKQRQKIEEPIPSYLNKKQLSNSKRSKKIRSLEESANLMNDEQMIELRKAFLKDGSDIMLSSFDSNILNRFMNHLREYSAFCASERAYDEAANCNVLYEKIKDEIQMRNLNKRASIDENEQFELEETQFSEFVQNKFHDFENELAVFDQTTVLKRNEMEDKLTSQITEFEAVWADKMPRRYRKPSSKLLDLLEMERKFSLTGRFVEAKRIKTEAERLQSQEMSQAQQRLVHDYQIAKKKLLADQNKERDLFEETRDHWRSVLIARHKVELETIENRKNVLNIKQTETKFMKDSLLTQSKLRDQNESENTMMFRRGNSILKDLLLPPLIAPNDKQITAQIQRNNEIQKYKIQQFKSRQIEKELRNDLSQDFNSPTDSSLLSHHDETHSQSQYPSVFRTSLEKGDFESME